MVVDDHQQAQQPAQDPTLSRGKTTAAAAAATATATATATVPKHSFEFHDTPTTTTTTNDNLNGNLEDRYNHDDDAHHHDHNKPTTASSPGWSKFISVVSYMPPWCRYDATKPPRFSLWYNVLFAFAGAFTVGNLYYSHPILNVLARDFNVSYTEVSRIPTLAQAGYCTGLVFVCPLGDLFRRRPLTLGLIAFTATMW